MVLSRSFSVAISRRVAAFLIMRNRPLLLTPHPTASNALTVPSAGPEPPARYPDDDEASRMPEQNTAGSLLCGLRRAGILRSPRQYSRPAPLHSFPIPQAGPPVVRGLRSRAATNAAFVLYTSGQSAPRVHSDRKST